MTRPLLALIALAAMLLISTHARTTDPPAAKEPVGTIATVAGYGKWGYSGDGGDATRATLMAPYGLAVGPDGSLYIADSANNRIRKVDTAGKITTVAGNGKQGFSGDGGPATEASLASPLGVAIGPDGSLYIADRGNRRIRRVGRSGIITTIAGNGRYQYSEGGPATKTRLHSPMDVAVAPDGTLYIADEWTIRRVSPSGTITTAVDEGVLRTNTPRGELGLVYSMSGAIGLALGADGTLYIACNRENVVRKLDPRGVVSTVAGDGWVEVTPKGACRGRFGGDDGPATKASLDKPGDVAVGPDGSLYIADELNRQIRKVDPQGIITTVVGSGARTGLRGDGGVITQASLGLPTGVAFSPDGSLYIADLGNRVRKVTWK